MATLKQQTKRLLDLMPVGELMRDKYDPDTNQYKFWTAIAMYYILLENDYATLIRELGLQTTELLVERWEKEFGIPDDVFNVETNLEDRIANIVLKKSGLNLLNIDEFRAIATRLGYTVTISTSDELRYPPYDVPFYPLSIPGSYFLVLIRGDFSVTNIAYLADFFEKLLAINVGMLLLDTSI